MSELAAPLQIASVGGALLWPLAAGVAVVLWSKARASARAKRIASMEGQLKSLYREVESKALPGRLKLVVDALKEGEELTASSAKTAARKGTPAGS